MPQSTLVERPEEDQAHRLAGLRRARSGSLGALHLVWWWAAKRPPTDLAAVLCCSRSRVDRPGQASRPRPLGREHDAQGRLVPPLHPSVRRPTLRRSLVARLTAAPHAYGWCRTRWRCTPLAATLQTMRGLPGSAEARRRWGHEGGWGWKRANLIATADDPHRVERLARLRWGSAPWRRGETLVWADDLARHGLPTGGSAWRPPGTPLEVMTPGTNAQHALAGALELAPGTWPHRLGPRTTQGLFRARLQPLDDAYPATHEQRLDVVVDHDQRHHATAVAHGLAPHPRVTRLVWPTDCPRANPRARACGAGHALGPRHPRRTRRPALVAEVAEPRGVKGPWHHRRAQLSDEPALTAGGDKIAAEVRSKTAA